MVIGSDGVWDVMSSAEVCGFVLKHEPKESVAEAIVNIDIKLRLLNVDPGGMK